LEMLYRPHAHTETNKDGDRVRDTHRDTQTHRHTERQTHRERDTQRDRDTDLGLGEGQHMDAVLYEDGLDLGLQLAGLAQHPHAVPVGVEGRALPRVDAYHHPVVLGDTQDTQVRVRGGKPCAPSTRMLPRRYKEATRCRTKDRNTMDIKKKKEMVAK